MSSIKFVSIDFSALAPPPAGKFTVGYDLDGVLKQMDSAGDVTVIGGSGGGVSDVTWAELDAMAAAGEMVPGASYRITDFQTVYSVPGCSLAPVIAGGPVEPIVVVAETPSALRPEAVSDVWARDQLLYELRDTEGAGVYGRIAWRRDAAKNLSAWHDWRAVRLRRWLVSAEPWMPGSYHKGRPALAADGNVYVAARLVNSLVDPASDPDNWVVIFNTSHYAYLSHDEDRWNFAPAGVDAQYLTVGPGHVDVYAFGDSADPDPDKFRNASLGRHRKNGPIDNNVFIEDFSNSSMGDESHANTVGSMSGCAVGSGFTKNVVGVMMDCTVGPNSYDNVIGSGMYYCQVGAMFHTNLIAQTFDNNRVDPNFQYNVFARERSSFNSFAPAFTSNAVLGTFMHNVVGPKCEQNTFNYVGQFRNNVFGPFFFGNSFGDACSGAHENEFGSYMWSNTFNGEVAMNRFGAAFTDNAFAGEVNGNSFGSSSYANAFAGGVSYNDMGERMHDNNVGANFNNNRTGPDFHSNTVGANFGGNRLGAGFSSNNVGDDFVSNSIGNGFVKNTVYAEFQNNAVGDNFYRNTVGDGMYGTAYFFDNVVGNDFQYNTVASNFRMNRVCTGVGSLDFSAATHVYAQYSCEIFHNSALAYRLSYVDGSDVTQVVSPTS
jgi:hypothetical protein